MTAVKALLIASPFAVTAAIVWLAHRYPRRFMVGRGPQHKSKVLYARLVPSPRELPGRPPAAGTASQVHVITDLPGHRARAARGEGNG